MEKLLRFCFLIGVFALIVACCSKRIPMLKPSSDIPIEPASVIFIVAQNILTEEMISGSGIVVESDYKESWVVSAAHVCYPQPEDSLVMWVDMWISMGFDISGNQDFAHVVALDQQADICILRLLIPNLPAVNLANIMPVVGDKVFLGAYPLGVYTPGHVPFFEGYYAGILDQRASYTIPVTGGSSGGGVVNSEGELVGIVSMALEGFENITLVARLEHIQALLDVAKKSPDRLTIIR